MGLGIIELLILGALAVLIVRGAGNGHVLSWLAAAATILLVVGLGMAVLHSTRREAAERHAIEVQRTQEELARALAERRARGEVLPEMHGELDRDLPRADGQVKMTLSGAGMILLVLLPLGAFAAMRAHRRGGAAPWLAAGGAGLGLLLIGWMGLRASHVRTVGVTEPMPQFGAATQPADEPIDELWERLNQPQIKLEADAQSAHDAAAATLVSEVNAAAEAAADAATSEESADPASDAEGVVEEAAAVDESTPTAGAEPDAHVADAPPPRPEWVGAPRQFANNVWRVPIEAGPYVTLQDCHAELEMEMRAAVETRIRDLVQERLGWFAQVPPLERMGLGTTFIYRNLLADQYVESGEASFGPTKTAWALLEFDPADDSALLGAWQGYARLDGMMIVVACSLAVLGVLALVYGLIQVDTWTRGYYSKRLFLGVPAAIIAMIVLFAMATA